jgi:hypothetical protein
MEARTVANGGKITDEVKRIVWKRDGGTCQECYTELTPGVDRPEYDHVIPWSLGGDGDVDNVQVLCKPCNARKGATLMRDAVEQLPPDEPQPPTQPRGAVDVVQLPTGAWDPIQQQTGAWGAIPQLPDGPSDAIQQLPDGPSDAIQQLPLTRGAVGAWLNWHQEWFAAMARHWHDTLIPWVQAHPETEPQAGWQMAQDITQWINAATVAAENNPNFAPLQEYAQKCASLQMVGKDGREVRVLDVVPDIP